MKKLNISIIKKILPVLLVSSILIACDDFLDKQPPSYIVPDDYYRSEDQLQAAVNAFYSDVLPSLSNNFSHDTNTDNQAGMGADSKYAAGQWKVGMTNDNWTWNLTRNINYQLNIILDRYEKKEITGSDKNIRQYIGELYFLRAYRYFHLLRLWGDLPIITEAFPDNEQILVAASKRMPRNEVARFILKDLDTAIEYMSENFEARRTRISPDAAQLFKSRVALFEGSWLTNFKGTPFVPNGEGWPGKAKDYNASYQFPTGDIDSEARYFFEIATQSAEIIAEKHKGSLVANTGTIPQSATDPENPYFKLFGNIDMTSFPEVLLWREYSRGLGIQNHVETSVNRGNMGIGLTRSMIEGFLMADGKPIYAQHNGYTYNDETLTKVRENRDPRLHIFLKEPDQVNVFLNMNDRVGDMFVEIEPIPDITNGAGDRAYTTGYTIRKGGTFDKALAGNYKGYTASITFRATEALLNYIEAQYMLTGNLSGKALEYWKIVREKAGFKGNAIDPNVTIVATDMSKEKLDWAAYTAGNLLNDPILYNIRRERRSELMAENLRWMDLIRWRSLDQLINEPYHIEGFHLWNTPMEEWYNFTSNDYNGSSSAKVSSPQISEYLRPYERNMTSGNLYKDGYTWSMAHYLQPMPIKQFQLTSSDYASIELSSLYQNPYWPTVADQPAIK
jgi:hypothetical protein